MNKMRVLSPAAETASRRFSGIPGAALAAVRRPAYFQSMRKIPLLAALVAGVLGLPALSPSASMAAEPATPSATLIAAVDLKASDRELVQRVEDYLNNIKTMQADFLQIASTGQTANGTLYLSRPGKIRVQYSEPEPAYLMANGTMMVYFEETLKQESFVPVSATPVAFLLADTIRLSGDVTVTDITHRDNVIRVNLVQTKDREAGSLSLVFSDVPLELRQWTVTDQQGIQTRISLNDTRYGGRIDPELFRHDQAKIDSPRN